MKLNSFEVSNFRSITSKAKLDFNNYSIIVGANNIGKSNLLNALILSLDLIKTSSYMKVIRGNKRGVLSIDRNQYIRERDFPFNLKDSDKKHTIFKLSFELSEDERKLLKNQYKLNLKTDITLKFDFTTDGGTYDVLMPGKAKKVFTDNKHNIAKFVAYNLKYEYIPCIRTASMSEKFFQSTLENSFSILERDKDYVKCMEIIKEKQENVLKELESTITTTLATYIPDVASVRYDDYRDKRRRSIRTGMLYIDDGVDTSLEFKGDGIKSLTAIALLSSALKTEDYSNTILCIEEPEAHLHSSAIYGIKKILQETAKDFQVIASTHSPILVDKDNVSNNIIVSKKSIRKCRKIDEIKEILGVRLSEELVGYETVLLVEGMSDEIIIKKLLTEYLNVVELIKKKKLKIINMRGGTKASNLAVYYNSLLISCHVLLDNDECGKAEYEKLITKGLLMNKDITLTMCTDMKYSEVEDTIKVDCYSDYIKEQFNVDLKNSEVFKKKNKEWSRRIKDAFNDGGQPFDEKIEAKIKAKLAKIVDDKGIDALYPHRKKWVEGLASGLKAKIK